MCACVRGRKEEKERAYARVCVRECKERKERGRGRGREQLI